MYTGSSFPPHFRSSFFWQNSRSQRRLSSKGGVFAADPWEQTLLGYIQATPTHIAPAASHATTNSPLIALDIISKVSIDRVSAKITRGQNTFDISEYRNFDMSYISNVFWPLASPCYFCRYWTKASMYQLPGIEIVSNNFSFVGIASNSIPISIFDIWYPISIFDIRHQTLYNTTHKL